LDIKNILVIFVLSIKKNKNMDRNFEVNHYTLQDVLKWLDDNFFTGEIEGYYSDVPEHIVQGKFDCKEDMINSFKEQFNIK
jgi:hypothetical protein